MSGDQFRAAATKGDVGRLTSLLGSGVSIDDLDIAGQTALMHASCSGQNAAVQLLLSRGANVNQINKYDQSALYFACGGGYVSVAELLLRSGADHRLKDKNGKTALDRMTDSAKRDQLQRIIDSLAMSPTTATPPRPPTAAAPTPATASVSATATTNKEKRSSVLGWLGVRSEATSTSTKVPQSQAAQSTPTSRPTATTVATSPTAASPPSTNVSTPAPLPVPPPQASASNTAAMEQLRAQLVAVTSERDALQSQLANRTREKESLNTQLSSRTTERDAAVADRTRLSTEKTQATTQLSQVSAQLSDRTREKEVLNTQLNSRTTERDAAVADRDRLRREIAQMTSQRDSLQTQLTQATTQLATRTSEKEALNAQLVDRTTERDRLSSQLAQRTTDLNTADTQLNTRTIERDQLAQERTLLTTRLADSTREKDGLQTQLLDLTRERDSLVAQLEAAQAAGGTGTGATGSSASAFERYRPHMFVPSLVPCCRTPGIHDVNDDSALFKTCSNLCAVGGSWWPSPGPVAGFKLVAVQAVVHDESYYIGYENKLRRITQQRQNGGDYFNFPTGSMNASQLLVLSVLRDQFLERAPGTVAKGANSFYCYHGPRAQHVASICSTGMVATGAMDAGFFGSGCYTTLNMEYALRYARGDFDADGGPRMAPGSRYPIIMFAATTGMVYPVTPAGPHGPGDYGDPDSKAPPGSSDFFGRPLKRGFDCHVVCVSQASNWQAVERNLCQYVEVVIENEAQLLPVAVLWFEEQYRT